MVGIMIMTSITDTVTTTSIVITTVMNTMKVIIDTSKRSTCMKKITAMSTSADTTTRRKENESRADKRLRESTNESTAHLGASRRKEERLIASRVSLGSQKRDKRALQMAIQSGEKEEEIPTSQIGGK
jgi:hypothetical protein